MYEAPAAPAEVLPPLPRELSELAADTPLFRRAPPETGRMDAEPSPRGREQLAFEHVVEDTISEVLKQIKA